MLVSIQSAHTCIDYGHNNPMLWHPMFVLELFFLQTIGCQSARKKDQNKNKKVGMGHFKPHAARFQNTSLEETVSLNNYHHHISATVTSACFFVSKNLQYKLWICAPHTGTMRVHLFVSLLGALCMLTSFPWRSHTQPLITFPKNGTLSHQVIVAHLTSGWLCPWTNHVALHILLLLPDHHLHLPLRGKSSDFLASNCRLVHS